MYSRDTGRGNSRGGAPTNVEEPHGELEEVAARAAAASEARRRARAAEGQGA